MRFDSEWISYLLRTAFSPVSAIAMAKVFFIRRRRRVHKKGFRYISVKCFIGRLLSWKNESLRTNSRLFCFPFSRLKLCLDDLVRTVLWLGRIRELRAKEVEMCFHN